MGSGGADVRRRPRLRRLRRRLPQKPRACAPPSQRPARSTVGDPILALKVPAGFSLKGSRAVYQALPNAVGEPVYQALGAALTAATVEEAKVGVFRFGWRTRSVRLPGRPKPEKISLKIDFAAPAKVAGLAAPMVLVTGAQMTRSGAAPARQPDGDKLIGERVEMPSDLMAETALLRFVSYIPSGKS